ALAGSDPLFLFKLTGDQILAAAVYGASGLAAHFCLTNAFRAADATVVIPLDFLRLPAIALVGWLLYGEAIDVFVLLGAAIVIAGVLWNLHAEAQGNPRSAAATSAAP